MRVFLILSRLKIHAVRRIEQRPLRQVAWDAKCGWDTQGVRVERYRYAFRTHGGIAERRDVSVGRGRCGPRRTKELERRQATSNGCDALQKGTTCVNQVAQGVEPLCVFR